MTYANGTAWSERPRMAFTVQTIKPKHSSPIQSLSYTGDRRWQAKSELWRLFEDCSADNWDEYGAKKVTLEAYEVALEFLDMLPKYVSNPEISADPDGEISFEWFRSDDRIITISVSSERKIAYAGSFGLEKPRGIENFGMDIPSRVMVYLSSNFGNVVPLVQD